MAKYKDWRYYRDRAKKIGRFIANNTEANNFGLWPKPRMVAAASNLWMKPLLTAMKARPHKKQPKKNSSKSDKIMVNRDNLQTDQGTFDYFDANWTISIANLSGNKIETKSIRQLNASTLCPVPLSNQKFYHKFTEYIFRIRMYKASSGGGGIQNVRATFFAIWPKGNWTPGEAATSFEATVKAQNNSLYKLEILADIPLVYRATAWKSDLSDYIHEIDETVRLDITSLMNRLQSSVNEREGLINETDATPCYIGMALRAVDDGTSCTVGGQLRDVRDCNPLPMKI